MGVYVKYMEMPEGCVTCYLKHDCCDFKQQVSSGNIINYIDKRLDCCPLVEVAEPHGRLIDADKLHEDMQIGIETEAYDKPFDYIAEILDAKAVIEAEG